MIEYLICQKTSQKLLEMYLTNMQDIHKICQKNIKYAKKHVRTKKTCWNINNKPTQRLTGLHKSNIFSMQQIKLVHVTFLESTILKDMYVQHMNCIFIVRSVLHAFFSISSGWFSSYVICGLYRLTACMSLLQFGMYDALLNIFAL